MWELFEKFREIYMKIVTRNVPDMTEIDQDVLVSMMTSKVDDVLFHPLQPSQRIDENIDLLLEKAKINFQNLALQYIHQSGVTYYHAQFLEQYKISPPSAVAEVIWDEDLIESRYNFFLEKRSPADRAKIMKWEEYKTMIYIPLKKKIDLRFPKGLDRDFFLKRQLEKLQKPVQNISGKTNVEDDIFAKNERLVKQKEAQPLQSPKVETKPKSPRPKPRSEPSKKNTQKTNTSEHLRDEKPANENEKSSHKKKEFDGKKNEKTAPKSPPSRPGLKSTNIVDSSEATTVQPIDDVESEVLNDGGFKPSLLDRMRMEAESRNKSEKPTAPSKKININYPPIFKYKGWRSYWSNSSAPWEGEWNGWRWTCGSFSKDCVSRKISPKKVKRGTDVNQDFLAFNRSQKRLRLLMFDGVSQSRAPRQWAETLAQTYAEMGLSIPELRENGTRITQWQDKAIERWATYIEDEYLPRRTHIPEWRLNNEVKTGHTTFISVEIHEKNIRVANLGDSAVFILKKDSTLIHLPSTYNHLLRPSNISTDTGYDVEEMEFYEGKLDDIRMMLAATDSIADYIFGKDEKLRGERCNDVVKNISEMEHPLEYLRRMIDIGPAGGGWLEDDVSFFTLTNSSDHQEEEE